MIRNDDARAARSATRSSSCAASSTTSSAGSPTSGLGARRRSCSASRSSSSSARASRSSCCCRVLLGYLEAAKSTPVQASRSSSASASPASRPCSPCSLFRTVFAALPVGPRGARGDHRARRGRRCSFYVSFWLIARLDHKRWLEFVKARVWSAVSVGSTRLAGARRLHRGLPRGLRDGALLPGAAVVRHGPRRATSLAGLGLGHRRARRRGVADLPPRSAAARSSTFLNVAVVLVMATSVAFLGNAVHALQAADVIGYTARTAGRGRRSSWPRPPATGRPCRPSPRSSSLTASTSWARIYMFLVKPRLADSGPSAPRPIAPTAAPA